MDRFRCLIFIVVAAALGGCKPCPATRPAAHRRSNTETERPEAISVIKGGGVVAANRPIVPPPAEIWKEFSGDKAFEETRKQVEIGPRPAGSPEVEKARVAIEESLRASGWDTEHGKNSPTKHRTVR